MLRIWFELVPDPIDYHIDIGSIVDIIEAPDFSEDRLARERPSRVLREEREQLELPRGEVYVFAGHADFHPVQVDHEWAVLKQMGRGRLLSLCLCAFGDKPCNPDFR